MPFIPAADTARVAMHFTQDNQLAENVFYVQSVAGWDAASLSTLGGIVKGWWTSSIQTLTANNVAFKEIVLKDMSSETGVEIVYSTGLPLVGSNGGNKLPNNVTIAMKLVTGLGGRSFRGRQYIIGITSTSLDVDPNFINSTVAGQYTTAYNALLTSIDAAYTPGLVIASFYHGVGTDGKPIPRTTAVLTAVTAALFADNGIDSQRRRLPGRGR